MVDSSFANAVSMQQLQALLSSDVPPPEATAGNPGNDGRAAQGNHQHPRLTSAQVVTLNSSGEATVTFTRTFSVMPTVVFTLFEAADNQPVIFKVKSFTQDGNGVYTGCTIKGYRMNTLPASISLLTALVSFSVTSGSAAGVQVACVALQVST